MCNIRAAINFKFVKISSIIWFLHLEKKYTILAFLNLPLKKLDRFDLRPLRNSGKPPVDVSQSLTKSKRLDVLVKQSLRNPHHGLKIHPQLYVPSGYYA